MGVGELIVNVGPPGTISEEECSDGRTGLEGEVERDPGLRSM